MDKTTATQHVARLVRTVVLATTTGDHKELRRAKLALVWWTKQITARKVSVNRGMLTSAARLMKHFSFSYMYGHSSAKATSMANNLIAVRQLIWEMTHHGSNT